MMHALLSMWLLYFLNYYYTLFLVLTLSHKIRNVINFEWKVEIMKDFTKLFIINIIEKRNQNNQRESK